MTPSSVFPAISRYFYVVVGIVVVGVLVGLGLAASTDEQEFTAEALVAVQPSSDAERLYVAAPDRFIQAEVLFVNSRGFRTAALEAAGLAGGGPGVSAAQVAETDLIRISATDPDPEVAERHVQAVADAYVEVVSTRLVERATAEIASIREEVALAQDELRLIAIALEAEMQPFLDQQARLANSGNSAPPLPAVSVVNPELAARLDVATSSLTELEARERELTVASNQPDVAVIVQPAVATPDDASSPRLAVAAASGLGALLVAAVVATALFNARDRVAGTADVEELLEQRVACQLPITRRRSQRWRDVQAPLGRAAREALARLHAELDQRTGETPKAVAVASVSSLDSPVLLSLMLGRYLATLDHEVVVVDLAGDSVALDRLERSFTPFEHLGPLGDLGEVHYGQPRNGPDNLHLLAYVGESPQSRSEIRPLLRDVEPFLREVTARRKNVVTVVATGPLSRSAAPLEAAELAEAVILGVTPADMTRDQLASAGAAIAGLDREPVIVRL